MKKMQWLAVAGGVLLVLVFCGCEDAEPRAQAGDRPMAAAGSGPGDTRGAAAAPADETKATAGKPAGHLTVDKETYDFGIVEPGAQVHGKFILTNDGARPVGIAKVGKSCGCTVPKLQKNELNPGESVPLEVSYAVGHNPGPTAKSLWVITDPPAEPRKLTMRVTANVKRIIKNEPARWEFELRESPQNHVPLELVSADGSSFSITRCVSSNEAVAVTFDPNVKAPKFSLPIAVDFDRLRKIQEGAVTLGIAGSKVKSVVVPFRVKMPFEVQPRSRHFRNLEPGQAEHASFVVLSNYGEPFELGNIRSTEGWVKVEKQTKRSDGYQIDVSVIPPVGDKRKLFKDQLLIEIKDHPEDVLQVQCYGIMRRAKS